VDVLWSDDAEVPTLDRRHVREVESLRGRNNRGIDRPQRKVAICGHELGYAQPVAGEHRLDGERAGRQVAEETHFGLDPQARREQVHHLCDDERWDDERPWVGLEQLERRRVVCIVGVDVRVERPGVDDDPGYRSTSAARISSMRSETSETPLRPAFAAPSRRRPAGPTR
jgi:hypothetical protein